MPPSVKPRSGRRRVLLLTSESALEAEVRDALWIRQQEKEPGIFFELTYVDPALFSDFLGVLDLLDHVRSGYFDMVHIVPSAATWSRSRHSQHSGQPPLRSRSSPLGLSSLSPAETVKINMANRALEVAAWVAEQSLQCPCKLIGLNIIFPEDLGGHCVHGPSSMWVLREFRFLEGVRDARRAAAYMCQFTRSEYKRPTGILSNGTSLRPLLFLGWPKLLGVQDSLQYRGPLPLSCSCGREHPPLIGLTDDSFLTSASTGFGAGFWTSCVYDDMLDRSFVSLRDGDQPDLTPLGDSPLLSPSLASVSSSLRSTYESWKAGTLTQASLVDIAPSDSIAAYFSAQYGSPLSSSFRSCLYKLWKVSSLSSSVSHLDGPSPCTTSSTPAAVSSLRTRSRSPCRMKRPLVLLRPRGDVSPAVTGAPPGSLSARCVVFTVSPCLIIFSLFSVL